MKNMQYILFLWHGGSKNMLNVKSSNCREVDRKKPRRREKLVNPVRIGSEGDEREGSLNWNWALSVLQLGFPGF